MPNNSENSKKRCGWVSPGHAIYENYHDCEWGVPVVDDRTLFEFLVLESAQAGLSWLTVLRKRDNYRRAFAGFDPQKVARFTEKRVQTLLNNSGIIRNRLKIQAAINNAHCFLEVQAEYGTFARYIWSFVDHQPIHNRFRKLADLPAKTKESELLSKDLKRRGFKFMGPTIVYAHMQATGMVNDHTTDCFRYRQINELHKQFKLVP